MTAELNQGLSRNWRCRLALALETRHTGSQARLLKHQPSNRELESFRYISCIRPVRWLETNVLLISSIPKKCLIAISTTNPTKCIKLKHVTKFLQFLIKLCIRHLLYLYIIDLHLVLYFTSCNIRCDLHGLYVEAELEEGTRRKENTLTFLEQNNWVVVFLSP